MAGVAGFTPALCRFLAGRVNGGDGLLKRRSTLIVMALAQ